MFLGEHPTGSMVLIITEYPFSVAAIQRSVSIMFIQCLPTTILNVKKQTLNKTNQVFLLLIQISNLSNQQLQKLVYTPIYYKINEC